MYSLKLAINPFIYIIFWNWYNLLKSIFDINLKIFQSNGRADCAGSATATENCNTQACPVEGQWGQWGGFTGCSATCGGGQKQRTRKCDSPPPSNGGKDCAIDALGDTEIVKCNDNACPVPGK